MIQSLPANVDRLDGDVDEADASARQQPLSAAEQNELQTLMECFERSDNGKSIALTMIYLAQAQQDQRLFTTRSGRFGYAMGSFRAGDSLVVFNGAPVPHIIRKREGDGKEYELVGVAYVRGMMHGEVEKLGLDSEEIVLT